MDPQSPWYRAALAAAAAHIMVWTVLLRAGMDGMDAVVWGMAASVAAFIVVGGALRLQDAARDRQLEAVPPDDAPRA